MFSTRKRQSTRRHRHFIACLIFDYSFVTVPLIFLLKVFFYICFAQRSLGERYVATAAVSKN